MGKRDKAALMTRFVDLLIDELEMLGERYVRHRTTRSGAGYALLDRSANGVSLNDDYISLTMLDGGRIDVTHHCRGFVVGTTRENARSVALFVVGLKVKSQSHKLRSAGWPGDGSLWPVANFEMRSVR